MINYLDNCATTVVYKEVVDEISRVLLNEFGNPSSLHKIGRDAENIIDDSRQLIADTINANKKEIYFNSCASEGNNQVLKSFKDHIITTKIEHPSVMNTLKSLEEEGVKVTYLDVDKEGKIDLEDFKSKLTKDTSLVSIMYVNNEIGVINPIEKIGRIIKDTGFKTKFHVDCVQAYMKYPIDVKKMNIDYLTVSSHKIHGPKGVGFIYIKKGLLLKPLIHGGSQESNLRAGTHNVAYISGMAKAIEILKDKRRENLEHVIELKNSMIEALSKYKNFKINSPYDSSDYILNVSFIGLRSEIILRLLEDKEVYVSTGSACSQKNMKDSHVLTSIGLNKDEIKGSIRICFSDTTTKEEIKNAIDAFDYALNFAGRIK